MFNTKLKERLDDTSFMVDGFAVFDSAYRDDNKDDLDTPGVVLDRGITSIGEDYWVMITGELPKADDEEAVENILMLK